MVTHPIIIIKLSYVFRHYDSVLMARCPYDLDKQLRILKDLCSSIGMIINIGKTKVMIIESKKITYTNFVYDNGNLEEVTSYKYLGVDLHHKLNWNYNIEKRINGGWKTYFGFEDNHGLVALWLREKKKLLFETLVTLVILYKCEVWGCNISGELWRKIEQIHKHFLYNLKLKAIRPILS